MSDVSEIFDSMEYGPAPEDSGIAREWIAGRPDGFGVFIDGAWRTPEDAGRFDTFEPASGQVLTRLTQSGRAEVEAAVGAARGALPRWRGLSGHERARFLYALARGIQKHARLFSVLETLDNGKPIRESRDIDIPLVARHFYHHAGWAQLSGSGELADHEPVGVVGQIIPWNFPLLMLAWKVAPALAAGNTVVLKPAEFTSLTALLFADLCLEVGLPNGVFNVVTGDGETGAALVAHPGVDKIAFTGSTEVGRLIREATAGSGKRLSLELGGKSPFVVFDDADLDSVVEGVVDAIWFNQGQVCCAGSRILVQEGAAATLVDRLRARMEKLRVGDPLDKATDMGAIVAPVQLDRIREMVEEGRREGAEVWQPSWGIPEEGWFYPPTLCTGLHPDARLAREEVFGPVVVLHTFRTPAEAIQMANDTRYGLAASIWTENVNQALHIAPAIKAGTVWVNCTNRFDAASGFGGYRESGFGREGGLEGLWEYLRPIRTAPSGAGEGGERAGRDLPTTGATLETPAPSPPGGTARPQDASPAGADPDGGGIDVTAKLYIGGRQARPDGGYTLLVRGPEGGGVGEVARGNRKDARNAVEAARKAAGPWAARTAHNRAQVLFYLAENLSQASAEFEARLRDLGTDGRGAAAEVQASVRRLFTYAAWADKFDGRVHATPFRNVTLAMNEPLGVVTVVSPETPALLGAISSLAPLLCAGNAVIGVLPGAAGHIAGPLYRLLDGSDVPGGVVNLLTGLDDELRPTLADHDGVDGFWYFGSAGGGADVERRSIGNMKRTWTRSAPGPGWLTGEAGEGEAFLREATQVKNIWIPYGE
jgi:aldehyde dehydrogenase (NAD+)